MGRIGPTIGLIGCGAWGRNILRDLRSLGCSVVVADVTPECREQALNSGAKQVFKNSDELPLCDGYVVATPILVLAQEAKKLLPRGVPIFSEKTLCPTMAHAEELASAGGEGRIFLMHKWEYHRGIQALRAIAESGRIGDLETVSCIRHGWQSPISDGDVPTRLAVHDLTIVRHILDSIPAPVFSLIRDEDGSAISLWAVLGEGPRAVLSIDWRNPRHSRSVTLHGTTGAALLPDAYSDHILVRDHSGEERAHFDNTMPLYDELKEFTAYLQGGPPPRCGFDHARECAMALDALRKMDLCGTRHRKLRD